MFLLLHNAYFADTKSHFTDTFILSALYVYVYVLVEKWDGSFEHPKLMLNIMGKIFLQFYAEKVYLSKSMVLIWTHMQL